MRKGAGCQQVQVHRLAQEEEEAWKRGWISVVLPLQMVASFEHQNNFIANQSPHLFFNLSSKGEAVRQVFLPPLIIWLKNQQGKVSWGKHHTSWRVGGNRERPAGKGRAVVVCKNMGFCMREDWTTGIEGKRWMKRKKKGLNVQHQQLSITPQDMWECPSL